MKPVDYEKYNQKLLNTMMEKENTNFANILIVHLRSSSQH